MKQPTILTVTLNAAVDIARSAGGVVSRAAGGKGNNAARVLASLGQQVVATGFAGGANGRFIQENLTAHGITTAFEEIQGESRVHTTILDQNGAATEVREQGPTVTEEDADRFLWRYRRLLGNADLVIISGSLPPGIPTDFYGQLVGEAWRGSQTRVLLDARGDALDGALPASPYLVKPNLAELEEWAGMKLPHDRAVLAAARQMMESGALVVAVSLGARGLLLVSPEGAWRAVPPAVEPVNHVGSGDSLLAGFAAGLMQGLPAEEILRLAVACGTANVLNTEIAVVKPGDLDRLKPLVKVERLG